VSARDGGQALTDLAATDRPVTFDALPVAADALAGDLASLAGAACGPGLTCAAGMHCGYSTGFAAAACDCDAGAWVCGAPAPATACPADTSTLAGSCGGFHTTPEVLCGSVAAGGCVMVACQATVGSVNEGWAGACELHAACLQPGEAFLGQPCVPGAKGCSCAYSVTDPHLVPCGCANSAGGIGGVWLQ
jgi:hypothetical protein